MLIHADFEDALKKIALSNENASCSIVRWQLQEDDHGLLPYLKTHLKLAGFKVSYDNRRQRKPFRHLLDEPSQGAYQIYLLPRSIRGEFQGLDSDLPHSNPNNKEPQHKLFIFPAREEEALLIQLIGSNYLDLAQYKNYYLLVLEILKRLFRSHRIETAMVTFQKRVETLSNFPGNEKPFKLSKQYRSARKFYLGITIQRVLRKKKHYLFSVFICLGAVSLWLHYSYDQGKQKLPSYQDQINLPIRSDLVIPVESALLDRPELRIQIENKFKERPDGIQTIALVGAGGAGKTTLARQFARAQKIPIVWEINAETRERLLISFENLAYALSNTEEEKREVKELQDISNLVEKEDKIIRWVKKHLSLSKRWLIIYDNVINFKNIHKYFPSDQNTWGSGQVIITTRNGEMQNNTYVNHLLLIKELDND